MKHPGLAVVGLLALWVGACQASSDEAGGSNGQNPPPTGMGGEGGSGGSPVSLDDFGYAAERESPAVVAAAVPKDAAISTICGEFDVNAV